MGRWSVWLTMGGIFLALATGAWIAPAMFLVGLAGSLLASALYLKAGLAQTGGAEAAVDVLQGLNLNLTFA